MDKMKQWVALTVVGVLAVVAAGWFLLVSPKRSEASAINEEAAVKLAANAQLKSQLRVLKALAKNQPEQEARLARVAAKIPDNPALPSVIRALTSAADDTSVELVSIAPTTPAPYAGAGAGAAAATAASGTDAAVAVPLQQIQLTINVVGGYFQVEQFLDRLEGLSRAMKVTAFTLQPGENPVKQTPEGAKPASETGKSLTGTITSLVFMQNAVAGTTATTATTTAG
jgi:Tfp pilus assembly protein PilO